jgi:hypothetical protein
MPNNYVYIKNDDWKNDWKNISIAQSIANTALGFSTNLGFGGFQNSEEAIFRLFS